MPDATPAPAPTSNSAAPGGFQNDAIYTIAENVPAMPVPKIGHAEREQKNLADAIKAFKTGMAGGEPAPAKVPTVRRSTEQATENVPIIEVPGISNHDAPIPTGSTTRPARTASPETPAKVPTQPPPVAAAPEKDLSQPPAAPAETPAPAAPETPLSRGWAEVTKREAANRQTAQSLRELQAKLDADKAAWEAQRKATTDDVATRLRTDPMKALEEAGWTPDKLLAKVQGKAVEPDAPKVPALPPSVADKPPAPAPTAAAPQPGPNVMEQIEVVLAARRYRDDCYAQLEKPEFALLKAHPQAPAEMDKFVAAVAAKYGQVLTPLQVATILQKNYSDSLQVQLSQPAVRQAFKLPPLGEPEPSAPKTKAAPEPSSKKPIAKTLTNSMGSASVSEHAPKPPRARDEQAQIADAVAALRALRNAE